MNRLRTKLLKLRELCKGNFLYLATLAIMLFLPERHARFHAYQALAWARFHPQKKAENYNDAYSVFYQTLPWYLRFAHQKASPMSQLKAPEFRPVETSQSHGSLAILRLQQTMT